MEIQQLNDDILAYALGLRPFIALEVIITALKLP